MPDGADNIILKNLSEGDILSFETIYRKYNKKIYNFSLRYFKNRDDAEEIVQEVFISLWEHSKSFNKESNLNAWLFTVTFNSIRKRFRKLSCEINHLERYAFQLEKTSDGSSEAEYFDLNERIEQLIAGLPKQQKKVFLLYRETGLSCSEIAKKVNLSKKTVENHLNRARSFLKKIMKEEGLMSLIFYWIFVH
jgi:RNA polymerase sigma-70 factor (family 1)